VREREFDRERRVNEREEERERRVNEREEERERERDTYLYKGRKRDKGCREST